MLIPGKIPYVKKAMLTMTVSAGVMIDQTEWVPAVDHHQRFNKLYPAVYHDLKIQIELDDKLLSSQLLDSAVNVEHLFEDSEEITDHSIKIKLSGFKESHQMYLEGIGEVSLMVKIDQICLEHLSLKRAFSDHGKYYIADSGEVSVPSEFMGQNGVHILNFTTPVYPWLLSVDKKFDYFYS
jgi:hypothetical protein